MRPRKFILPQAGTDGYGIRPYVFEAAEHQPSRGVTAGGGYDFRWSVYRVLPWGQGRGFPARCIPAAFAAGSRPAPKRPGGLSCSSKATLSTDASICFAFIWSFLCIGNSRDGQSRPALRQCSYFLPFLRHNSTNSTAEHSASTNKSAGRAASPVCGIRNVGAVVCAGGVAGGASPAGVCALTGAGIVLACSGVNRPLSSSCGTKGECKGKGSEFFHG